MAATKHTSFSPSILSPIFLLFLYATPGIATSGNCDAGDKAALLAIKNSFQSPDVLSSWTNDTACCDWAGVQCTDDFHRVFSVRILSSNTLSGSIPKAITDLPFLTILVMSNLPKLTGAIPCFVSSLSRLSILNLHNNSLSGPIPSFLSQLSSLRWLDLSYNNFSGSIPAELSLLKGLLLLTLSNNFLTGGIPASFGSFNVSFPPELDLSNNLLSGKIPPELGQLDWGVIVLSNNKIGGDASVLFGSEKRATRINLAWNRFQFDLSAVSFPLNLFILNLSHNEINGSIAAQINQLPHLTVLNLSYNNLCNEIPAGAVTAKFGKEGYEGNKCLCGAPLGPCPQSG